MVCVKILSAFMESMYELCNVGWRITDRTHLKVLRLQRFPNLFRNESRLKVKLYCKTGAFRLLKRRYEDN